jgi:hypothetical protein
MLGLKRPIGRALFSGSATPMRAPESLVNSTSKTVHGRSLDLLGVCPRRSQFESTGKTCQCATVALLP